MNIVMAIVLACIVQYMPDRDFQRAGDGGGRGGSDCNSAYYGSYNNCDQP